MQQHILGKRLSNTLLDALKKHAQFLYAPTLEEWYRELPLKLPFDQFSAEVAHLVQDGRCLTQQGTYTLPGHRDLVARSHYVRHVAAQKIKQLARYRNFFALHPGVQGVYITGSVAAHNAQEQDDIDLFIITKHSLLWLTRLSLLIPLRLVGIARAFGARTTAQVANKLCFNLWFDGSDLVISPHKQNAFVAGEIVRMEPFLDKKQTYAQFLAANSKWLTQYVPNISLQNVPPEINSRWIWLRPLERGAQWIQLRSILSRKTREYITSTQLWFFPDDKDR